jgi:RNA polymerase primary sigma factor
LSADHKFQRDEISQLLSKGRKQGYLLFEEVNKTFHEDLDSHENFDDFLSSMDGYGIKILGAKRTQPASKKQKSDQVSLHVLDRTTDPVKLYLREMGNISLLTREGEIAIAREIERGEKNIIKALSKTRLVLNQVLALEEQIKTNLLVFLEMFDLSDEEITEDKLEEKKKEILARIKRVRELYRKMDRIPGTKKHAFARGRIIVQISRLIRELNIRPSEREKIIDSLRGHLRRVNELEDSREEVALALSRARGKISGELLKQKLAAVNKQTRAYHKEIGLDSQGLRKTLRAITTGKKVSDQAKKELVANRGRVP